MWLLIFSLWHQKENKGIWNANTFIYKKDWYKNKSELKKKLIKRLNQKEEIKKYVPPPYQWKHWLRIKTKTTLNYNKNEKIEQGNIINKTKISQVKVNVLPINSIEKNNKLLDSYIDCVCKKQ